VGEGECWTNKLCCIEGWCDWFYKISQQLLLAFVAKCRIGETEMTANDDVVQGWRDGIPLKRGGTTEDGEAFLRIRYERLRNRTK
jgi:hypothetical protein